MRDMSRRNRGLNSPAGTGEVVVWGEERNPTRTIVLLTDCCMIRDDVGFPFSTQPTSVSSAV